MADKGKKDSGFKLGDISPLAGLVTNEGLTSGMFGGIPGLINSLRNRGRDDEEEVVGVAAKGPGMKKGGSVGSACMKRGGGVKAPPFGAKGRVAKGKAPKFAAGGSVRGCGAAMRGKTRGTER